jgi:hypothetical protein
MPHLNQRGAIRRFSCVLVLCKSLVGESNLSPGTTFRARRNRAPASDRALQRPLLVAAFLAGVGNAGLAWRRRDSVGRAALAADGFDPGIALLDGDGLALQRLSHQSLGFVALRLFRHFGISSSVAPRSYMRLPQSAMRLFGLFPHQRFAPAVAPAECARPHAAAELRFASRRAIGVQDRRTAGINALEKSLRAGRRDRANAGIALRGRFA